MKYLVLGTYKPHIKEIVTNAFYFLVFFFLLIPTSFATDVSTSFETTNISGSFTLGTSPKTVTFTNGEAKFAGIASLYHSGSQAFMVQNDTTTITFETAAASINVFLKAQSGAVGAEVNIYDINENLVEDYFNYHHETTSISDLIKSFENNHNSDAFIVASYEDVGVETIRKIRKTYEKR